MKIFLRFEQAMIERIARTQSLRTFRRENALPRIEQNNKIELYSVV